jgi:hypothetical protein
MSGKLFDSPLAERQKQVTPLLLPIRALRGVLIKQAGENLLTVGRLLTRRPAWKSEAPVLTFILSDAAAGIISGTPSRFSHHGACFAYVA